MMIHINDKLLRVYNHRLEMIIVQWWKETGSVCIHFWVYTSNKGDILLFDQFQFTGENPVQGNILIFMLPDTARENLQFEVNLT